MKLAIKGILTQEDAGLCVEHGVDGIVVSNHGGRAEDSGLSTIEVLPEIVDVVGGKIPILVDSGFRRGSDFFKAMALGASRPGGRSRRLPATISGRLGSLRRLTLFSSLPCAARARPG